MERGLRGPAGRGTVPVANIRGPVSDRMAQVECSRAAHEAGRDVLAGAMPTSMMCGRFRELMEAALVLAVPGAKVGFLFGARLF